MLTRKANRSKNVRRRLRHLHHRRRFFEVLEQRLLLVGDADFGDAPAPYPTLLSQNGAFHYLGGPTLGTLRDVEADGQPSLVADGDGDDEGEA